MEEPEKKEYEELTRKSKIEKGSSKEKRTLEQKLNKEKLQKKGKRREKCKTSGQNKLRKTKHVCTTNASWPYTWHSTALTSKHHKCAIHGIRSIRQICSYLV